MVREKKSLGSLGTECAADNRGVAYKEVEFLGLDDAIAGGTCTPLASKKMRGHAAGGTMFPRINRCAKRMHPGNRNGGKREAGEQRGARKPAANSTIKHCTGKA